MAPSINSLLFDVFTLICVTIYFGSCLVDAERTSQKIYKSLSPNFACFRRLNGTHQIGCSSERRGNVGVIHYVANNVTELDRLLENGQNSPYVIVVDVQLFNFKNLSKMEESEKINGLLVLSPDDDNSILDVDSGFSPDQSCPNRGHGLYDFINKNSLIVGCSIDWNPHGDAMFFHDWSFPIFLVRNQTDIDNLLNSCYKKFNVPLDGQSTLCAAQLSSNMFAARDAQTCIRRSSMITNLNPMKVCDPLGDFNIWAPLFPMNKSTPVDDRSLIFVVARMDAFSMFDNIAPGADAAVTGVVGILAAAEALTRIRSSMQRKSGKRNVIFVLFNGEAFDNIGSSRMLYDMQRDLFPDRIDDDIRTQWPIIKLQHISQVIELNQVGIVGDGNGTDDHQSTLWVHTDPLSTGQSLDVNVTVDHLVSLLKTQSSTLKSFSVNVAEPNNPLPPSSSLQTFLKNDLEISGVVLTDHNLAYSNRYYNSFLDVFNSSTLTVDLVHSTATLITKTVYALLTGEENDTLTASRETVTQLFNYYSRTANSTFAPYTISPNRQQASIGASAAPNLYVGVDISMSEMRYSTNNFLALLMGDILTNVTSSDDCKNPQDNTIFTYRWMPSNNGPHGICVKSTVNVSKAISPAFDIQDYDYTSGQYSTWTESVWDEHSLRIFLKPSRRQEFITLFVGLIILSLSFVVVWFLSKNSDVLFPNNGSSCSVMQYNLDGNVSLPGNGLNRVSC